MRLRSVLLAALALGSLAVVVLALAGRHPFQGVWQSIRRESPHQRYARSLAEGGLAHTALATEWLAAATRAVQKPVVLSVPFAEAALLDPARQVSLGYAVTLKRGQTLSVQVTVETDTPGHVFIDLFPPGAQPETRAVASAALDETALSHDARQSGVYVLRVQPELLRGGHVRVTSAPAPSLRFPVSGGGARHIQSVFGDARDAGSRRHEGVDIFAPRGTPVVAASDGFVRNGENTLGGRVVWLWDMSRGIRVYYAHLDEQLVRTGAFVRAGDTIGTVGNTGNARTTAPHLHFGIYAGGEGAIDPDAFIRPLSATAAHPHLKTAVLGAWGRARRPTALRASPAATAPVVGTLPRAAVVRVEGTLGQWVRTTTAGQTLFVDAREVAVE
jgi:murein DD-endopeptidase MepM/ murein hydrolase activator NlpD